MMVEDIGVRCTETASKEELEESGVLTQFLILDHNSVYLSPCQSSQAKTSSTWNEYLTLRTIGQCPLRPFLELKIGRCPRACDSNPY